MALGPVRFQAWTDFFSPRQLLGHCTSVEVFHELVDEIRERNTEDVPRLDKAASDLPRDRHRQDAQLQLPYRVAGMPTREVLRAYFDRHDFCFKWSYAEMAPTITGLGYDWAIEQTGKSSKN